MASNYNGRVIRNVRNYWITGTIDGRTSPLTGGPRDRTGGLELRILQRDRGDVITAAIVNGYVLRDPDGRTRLALVITDRNGDVVHRSTTYRDSTEEDGSNA